MIDDDPEIPKLTSLSELWTLKELSDKLGLKPVVLSKMRWGDPKLPYVRFGQHVFFIESQVVWFLNKWQRERPDPYYVDRMRRLKSGLPVGRGRMPHHPKKKDLPRD